MSRHVAYADRGGRVREGAVSRVAAAPMLVLT